jgi:hypothetical protein
MTQAEISQCPACGHDYQCVSDEYDCRIKPYDLPSSTDPTICGCDHDFHLGLKESEPQSDLGRPIWAVITFGDAAAELARKNGGYVTTQNAILNCD